MSSWSASPKPSNHSPPVAHQHGRERCRRLPVGAQRDGNASTRRHRLLHRQAARRTLLVVHDCVVLADVGAVPEAASSCRAAVSLCGADSRSPGKRRSKRRRRAASRHCTSALTSRLGPLGGSRSASDAVTQREDDRRDSGGHCWRLRRPRRTPRRVLRRAETAGRMSRALLKSGGDPECSGGCDGRWWWVGHRASSSWVMGSSQQGQSPPIPSRVMKMPQSVQRCSPSCRGPSESRLASDTPLSCSTTS